MNTVLNLTKGSDDTIFIPMTMLSLLVLSVATMGFLFEAQSLRLFLDNQRGEAVTFFLKTLGTCACFMVLFIAVLIFASW